MPNACYKCMNCCWFVDFQILLDWRYLTVKWLWNVVCQTWQWIMHDSTRLTSSTLNCMAWSTSTTAYLMETVLCIYLFKEVSMKQLLQLSIWDGFNTILLSNKSSFINHSFMSGDWPLTLLVKLLENRLLLIVRFIQITSLFVYCSLRLCFHFNFIELS